MLKKSYVFLFILGPLLVFSQEKLSKKELREQRKKEKIEKQYQDFVATLKDTSFSFYPYKISSRFTTGNDGGMFTISKSTVTFFNVLIPTSADEAKKRIESYFTSVENYILQQEESTGRTEVSLSFKYNNTPFTFLWEHQKGDKWAVGKLFSSGRLIATYEGPLKQ